jgi:uncharacterized membrane-anchored protein
MDFPLRRKKHDSLPGRTLVVRTHRNLGTLLTRVQPGDLVVLDRLDLDADTARALADRKPYAVLNAAEFISGRYANRGPRVLVDAGVRLYRGRREQVLALRDEQQVRLDAATLYDDTVVLLDLDELTPDQVASGMERAHAGLAVQLESFAHSASELVHREEPLLLHGTGLPVLTTPTAGRVVVVVGPAARVADLKKLRRFVRRARPVLIGVDAGVDVLGQRGLDPDVAVLSGSSVVGDKALRRCREVVLVDRERAAAAQVEKLNLTAHEVATRVAPADVALLLARAGGARLVVPVGTPATLEELIDRERGDQASNVLTRLRLGTVAVEGDAVLGVLRAPRRPWRSALAVVVALAVVAAVLSWTTPGERWRHDLTDRLPQGWGGTASLHRERSRVAARDREIAALQADLRSATSYADATDSSAVRGTLTGRTVTLVLLPGADRAAVDAVKGLLAIAGAEVAGETTVLPAVADDKQSGLVGALTSQLLTQAPDVHVPAGTDGAQRLGALLARAVGVPASARVPKAGSDARAVGIASGLQTAGLVSAKVGARAALTLAFAGTGSAGAGPYASLLAAYGSQVPTVVVGESGSPVLAALRRSAGKAVSTVDPTSTTVGRVSAVLALAARARGQLGSFGRTGSDGAVPPTS